jgi:hypothetical protein
MMIHSPDHDTLVDHGALNVLREVKPIVGAWLETISGKRWTLRYGSGTQRDLFPVAPHGQRPVDGTGPPPKLS